MRPVLWLPWALLLLLAGTLFASQQATAQTTSQSPHGDTCGQTRFVLIRFPNGSGVPGVRTVLTAAPASMGGPEIYVLHASDKAAEAHGDAHSVMPMLPILPTPGIVCHAVFTGTLATVTDAQGLARFDGLGEGTWVLHFEGTITRGQQAASVVPSAVQGRFPYGRTRDGGGFIERVDSLNEEGGPNPGAVQPGVGVTTSRYLLQFSAEYGGWLPELDLASDDGAPPLPLADMATTSAPTPTQASSESAFDPSSVTLATSQGTAFSPSEQATQERAFSLWWAVWVAVFGLALGGVVSLAWGRRASEGKRDRRDKWDKWDERRSD